MTSKPFKPTLSEAALVEWILGDPKKRFAVHYRNSGGIHLCERTVRREDGRWEFRRIGGVDPSLEDQPVVARFGGKLKFDPHGLQVAGLAEVSAAATSWPDERKRYETLTADLYRPTPWSYDSAIVTLTTAAADWWAEKGKAAHGKMLAKLEEKKSAAAANERVAIFGARQGYGGGRYSGLHADVAGLGEIIGKAESIVPKWTGMRPAFSAVIVRETETRFYLRDAQKLTNAYLRTEGGIGRNAESYIEKKYLILDNATAADIARLKAFDEEIQSDYVAMRESLIDEMVPVLIASMARHEQKAAEIDGTFKEMMESIRPGK